jgi:DNA-binding MarR family transcriptional regulator
MQRSVKSSATDQVDATAPSVSLGAGNELSFALYGAASRMVRLHKPFLEPLGITFPQYLVLLELCARTPRTVGDLCAKLSMDTGTLTPLLKRLEVSGKVTRTRDLVDERRVLVDFAPAGEALRGQIQAVSGQIKSACKLDEQGLVDLKNTLDALAWPADRAGDQ